jgi:nitrogen fixation-related uncharacterized protein
MVKIKYELSWAEQIQLLNEQYDDDKKFREAVLTFCYDENKSWNKRLEKQEMPTDAIKEYIKEFEAKHGF